MRKIVLIVLIIIEVFMGVLTFLTSNLSASRHLFAGGSIESTMKIFEPSFWVTFILFLVSILITILLRKKVIPLLLTFSIISSIWFFCGRTIGIHWTGEIITGWFYIATDKINLCESVTNCNDIIDNTEVNDSHFFFLKLVGKTSEEKKIFVGPIIYEEIKNYFYP